PRLRHRSRARDHTGGHATARVEDALDLDEPRRAVGDQPLEHLVHDLLLEDLPLAEPGQVVAQRLELVELRVGDVADRELAEVGAARHRADGGELRRTELDEVFPLLVAVLERLDHAAEGTGGTSPRVASAWVSS